MKILDIALKDLTRSLRSFFFLGMMIGAPLLLIGLIYFAFSGAAGGTTDLPAVKVGVVNLDVLPANSPMTTSLGASIRSMFFDGSVMSWLTATDYADEASARAAVDGQAIGVAVIVPRNFSEHFLAGKTDLQVLIVNDPTLTIGPQVVENMVISLLDGAAGGGIAVTTVMERQQANGITPDPAQVPALIGKYSSWYMDFQRNLFHSPDKAALVLAAPSTQGQTENPMQKMIGLMMAGQMVFFAFFTAAYSMGSILREDEEGTLSRLFTTPTDRTIILSGKFLAVFLSVGIQSLVMISAAHFAFGVDWGRPASLMLAFAGQIIAASGLGVLLISFVKTSKQEGPVLGGGLTILGMVSGLFTANINMPESFAMIANFTPQGWVLKSWRIVMNGQPFMDILVPFAVLLVMGVAMFVVGARMFGRRYA